MNTETPDNHRYSFENPENPNFLDTVELERRHAERAARYMTAPRLARAKDIALSFKESQRLPEGVEATDVSDLAQISHEIAHMDSQIKLLKNQRDQKIRKFHGEGISISWLSKLTGLTRQSITYILK